MACSLASKPARADGNVRKVNHIIIVVQENHSFDNYFGVLPYAPGSPYHLSRTCAGSDHKCIDGLTCTADASGNLTCSNSNLDDDRSTVKAFHATTRCVRPDLDHSWLGTHREMNFENPNATLLHSPANGFVRVNDATEHLSRSVPHQVTSTGVSEAFMNGSQEEAILYQ